MKAIFVAAVMLCAYINTFSQTVKRELAFGSSSQAEIDHPTSYHRSLYDVNIRAVRNFKTFYPDVDNETWFAIPNGYRARFTNEGIKHDVTYNKRGNWLYTVRQYQEALLDTDVRACVKSIYYDYTIILVEEVESPKKPLAYVVHMEDAHTIKKIQVCDREIETLLEVNKTDALANRK